MRDEQMLRNRFYFHISLVNVDSIVFSGHIALLPPIMLALAISRAVGDALTPSFRNVSNKFSVKYFLNLVLVDDHVHIEVDIGVRKSMSRQAMVETAGKSEGRGVEAEA